MSSSYYVPTLTELHDCPGAWLFADGGLCGANGSATAGTWAYVIVQDCQRVESGSGVLTAATIGLPTISNNVTELYALCKGMRALGEGWRGTICSDSHVTLCRRFPTAKMEGVPEPLIRFARCQFSRFVRTCNWVLLDGHPTRAQLAAGVGKRQGPVSQWNVWCDKECTKQAKECAGNGK